MTEIKFKEIEPGTILYTSWGYDVTNNDYCKVLENTGKTLKCVMIGATIVPSEGYAYGAGEEMPNPDHVISEPFRLRIIHPKRYSPYISGTYQYCRGGKRKGYFWLHSGKANYFSSD